MPKALRHAYNYFNVAFFKHLQKNLLKWKYRHCHPLYTQKDFKKGGYYDHFWIHRKKWSFWYQMKAPIFLIMPVKFCVQQMLLVKVIRENVAKVR